MYLKYMFYKIYFKCIFKIVNIFIHLQINLVLFIIMQLTKHTDFAFRVLIYLANMQQDKTTITEITDFFGISRAHLMKVVNALVNAGWVKSSRGKGGGITLGVSPQQVSVKDVIVQMESTLAPVNCNKPICAIYGACRLQGVLFDAQTLYLNALAEVTLADLVCGQTKARIQVRELT